MKPRINYEHLARDYASHRRVHPEVLTELIAQAGLNADSNVVEVGSGTGNYLIAMQEATGCSAVGIEPSAAMLEQAKNRRSRCQWMEGRAESLPLEPNSVDLVFTVDVIHHIGDRNAFFHEARRVLRSGGNVCTVTDSDEDILRRRPLSSHFPETIDHELRRYPTISTLRSEMSAAGFSRIWESHVELAYDLIDVDAYRNRAFSALHLITEAEFGEGMANLESDLLAGPVSALSLYTLVWGDR